MKIAILVPVKDLQFAKQRLSSLLTASERKALVWAMYLDLGRALRSLSHPIYIVTRSELAAAQARDSGWKVLLESMQVSESFSVDKAAAELTGEGFEAVLRIPADLPLLRAEDIAAVLGAEPRLGSAVIVPSEDGRGTNALLRTPPDLFPSRFGPNSLVLHIQEALRARADYRIMRNENMALDLDDPSDILRFLEKPSATYTYQLLLHHKVKERILELADTRNPYPGT